LVEREEAEGKSSISRDVALRVVASTIVTANQSVSGTTAGNSVHSSGNSVASGNSVSSSSNSGINTSSSPSMSDQFASATAQTNQVLDMSSTSIDTSSSSNTFETETVTTEVVVVDVATNTQDSMDISVSSVNTDVNSETTVENIIAKNLQTAQDSVQEQQEESGKYGSENAIIAVMGFVPGFNGYKLISLPEKDVWYEPKSIYTNNTISDNTLAFYRLAGQSIETLTDLKKLQPRL